MNKHPCPSCDAPFISVWQKLWLGPLREIKCKSCGAFISVPWLISMLVMGIGALAPWGFGFLAYSVVSKPTSALVFILSFFSGFILGTVLFFWFYNRYVPLVIKRVE